MVAILHRIPLRILQINAGLSRLSAHSRLDMDSQDMCLRAPRVGGSLFNKTRGTKGLLKLTKFGVATLIFGDKRPQGRINHLGALYQRKAGPPFLIRVLHFLLEKVDDLF